MENGISIFITEEINFFITSMWLGVGIAVVYDSLRVFRKEIPHHVFFITVEDLLFWIITGISIFCLQYYENNGSFRFFSIIAVWVGMCVYYKTISAIYSKCISFFLGGVVKVISVLLKCFHKIRCGFIKKGQCVLHPIRKNIKLFLKITKNRLTGCKKVITVTLGGCIKK
ncbi:MAG: spore cortex biosynthesis protein YabQ [Eubacteriales bacterium]